MMNNKRQQAMKRNKRKNRIIAAICFAILIAIVAFFVINQIRQRDNRIYVNGRNTVTLYTNGTFSANLPHDVVRNGTFSESTADGVTTVAFYEDGMTVNGFISGNILTIPIEWDDGHLHPRNYILRSSQNTSRFLYDEFNDPRFRSENMTNETEIDESIISEPYLPPDSFELSDYDGIIVINENSFSTQIFEIMMLYTEYLGRTIQLEGMFFTTHWDGQDFHLVYRWTLSCCGERMTGFEVVLQDIEPFQDDIWVKAVGILDTDGDYLVLRLISITETEPGQEFVPSW